MDEHYTCRQELHLAPWAVWFELTRCCLVLCGRFYLKSSAPRLYFCFFVFLSWDTLVKAGGLVWIFALRNNTLRSLCGKRKKKKSGKKKKPLWFSPPPVRSSLRRFYSLFIGGAETQNHIWPDNTDIRWFVAVANIMMPQDAHRPLLQQTGGSWCRVMTLWRGEPFLRGHFIL